MTQQTKVAHTPGPWTYNRDTVNERWRIVRVQTEGYGALGSAFNQEADARLIAAAPELLEACKKALTCGLDTSVRRLIIAAIAKAEGK